MGRNTVFGSLIGIFLLGVGGVLWYIETQGETHDIVRNNDGYVPASLTIKKGDTVRFINESDDFHWPASDLHPTHGIYPAFDPRRPVAVGEVWEFRFTEVGEWDFHDHLHAYELGTIVVVE